MSGTSDDPTQPDRPVLRVVRGDATPEEVAALVSVVAAMSGVAGPAQAKPRSSWADPARRMRTALRPGTGGWRASGLPH